MKWKPLNMTIRSLVINRTLRLEETSSDALRAIFRMMEPKSKTLGNSSNALSFKSKIDLLSDLGEIDHEDYKHLQKLMEIRNQFAHNPKAVSFEAFEEINPEIFKYLLRQIAAGSEKLPLEKQFIDAFELTFERVAGKLLIIELEYTKGMVKQMEQHVDHLAMKNIEAIWLKAVEDYKKSRTNSYHFLGIKDKVDFNSLFRHLMINLFDFKGDVSKTLENDFHRVFKAKVTVEEQVSEITINKEEDGK